MNIPSQIVVKLTLSLAVSLAVSACGGRSPKTVAPKPTAKQIKLGPTEGKAPQKNMKMDDSIFSDDSLAGFDDTRTLCSKEEHQKTISLARSQLASRDYERALETLQTLKGECTDGRDDLLLVAATKDKLAQGRAQGKLSVADCSELLLSWQSYISFQASGDRPSKYLNRAIGRANELGEECGAWASWRTEPSGARLFVQGHALGMSPVALWLPAGEVSYTAKQSTRQHQGKLSVKAGEELSLTTRLTDIITPPHQIKASILCDRPSSEEPLKRCTGSLLPGDRFRVTVKAGEEPVYLYVMSVNEKSADLIFPARRAAPLKPKSLTALPTDDAYQLDDQTKSDAVVVMTSLNRVELLSQPSQGEKKSAWEKELRALIEAARVAEQDEVTEGSDEQGWVMIRWNLKPSPKGSSQPGDQS